MSIIFREMEEPLAQRYFTALKESRPANEFYDKAIYYLARHEAPYRKHMDNFMALKVYQPVFEQHKNFEH